MQVLLLEEHLQEQAVAPRERVPVDEPQIVAGHISAEVGELDALPLALAAPLAPIVLRLFLPLLLLLLLFCCFLLLLLLFFLPFITGGTLSPLYEIMSPITNALIDLISGVKNAAVR